MNEQCIAERQLAVDIEMNEEQNTQLFSDIPFLSRCASLSRPSVYSLSCLSVCLADRFIYLSCL